MKDVALMHQEIVKKLSKYENGVVSETMDKMGLKYAVNFGLSLMQVDRVAKNLKKNTDLAIYLWQQKERESKLLSVRLLNDYNLSKLQLDCFTNGITNVELAEQVALHIFSRLINPIEIATNLIAKSGFIQLSGYILISQLAMANKSIRTDVFESFLTKIVSNLPKNKPVYIKRGISRALLKIGLRNLELNEQVKKTIEIISKKEPSLSDYLNQEVCYYLIENN